MLETHNENRKEKVYHVGQVIYEKKHGERNKLKTRYKKQVVKENLPNKIIINNRNRIEMTFINFKLGVPEQYYKTVFSNEFWPQSVKPVHS